MCPRCAHDVIESLHTSPVPGAWEVLLCQRCQYSWRTSEPARRTERDAFPESFRMTPEDIAAAPEIPSIPVLRGKGML
ncbi:non-oxidative hydroxyarylic acid decarboxylases subunit D [Kutzneria sp. NPDC052558]|uniref:non-oxidative hydroxyarylic acid decarboxylases subunit D n=1 Tax=Kutzneria sp. NPDC052558 TaxID=3364121 RepID=UPI0037C8378E